jgi:hypothetical protein
MPVKGTLAIAAAALIVFIMATEGGGNQSSDDSIIDQPMAELESQFENADTGFDALRKEVSDGFDLSSALNGTKDKLEDATSGLFDVSDDVWAATDDVAH